MTIELSTVFMAIFGLGGTAFLTTIFLFVRWILKTLEGLDSDIVDLDNKVFDNVIHKNDCSGKQELWQERHSNILEKFDLVLEAIDKSEKSRSKQTAEFALQLEVIEECIKAIELGKEC